MGLNNTDYDFPQGWGLYDDEQKSDWFLGERVFRQAVSQKTTFGDKYRADMEAQKRVSSDQYKVDDDKEFY